MYVIIIKIKEGAIMAIQIIYVIRNCRCNTGNNKLNEPIL